MQQLQIAFDEYVSAKYELKGIKAMYKDALEQTDHYLEICDQIKELRKKRKHIETVVQNQMGKTYEKIEELTQDVKEQKILISDIAMNIFTEGKTVEVQDAFGNIYEPDFKVNLKKSDKIKK